MARAARVVSLLVLVAAAIAFTAPATAQHAGMCSGLDAIGDLVNITGSTCAQCQEACAVHDTCFAYSWAGSEFDRFSSNTPCLQCQPVDGYSVITGADHPGNTISCFTLDVPDAYYAAVACNNNTNCSAFVMIGNQTCLKSSSTSVASAATASYCLYVKSPVATCAFFASTTPLNITTNASCSYCQSQCLEHPNCTQYSWNASSPASYSSLAPCNGGLPVQETLCYGMTGEGYSLEFPIAANCEQCRQICEDHATCLVYSWDGGVADSFFSSRPCQQCPSMESFIVVPGSDHPGDNITCMPIERLGTDLPLAADECLGSAACGGFVTYGNQTCLKSSVNSPQTSVTTAGFCLYSKIPVATCSFFANTTTLNTTTTSCLLCGFLCRTDDLCTEYSWNGSSPVSFNSNDPCDGGPPPRPDPPAWLSNCSGYRSSGASINISGDSCSSCRASCAATTGCATFSFAGSSRTSPSSSSACSGCVGWSFTGGRAVVSGATCSACAFSCLEGINCSFYSWQGGEPTPFDNNTQCSGPAIQDSCDGFDYDGSEVTITGATCDACADACREALSCEEYSFQGHNRTYHTSKLPCIVPPATGCQAYDSDARPLNVTGATCQECRNACLDIGWCDYYAFDGAVLEASFGCNGEEDLTGEA